MKTSKKSIINVRNSEKGLVYTYSDGTEHFTKSNIEDYQMTTDNTSYGTSATPPNTIRNTPPNTIWNTPYTIPINSPQPIPVLTPSQKRLLDKIAIALTDEASKKDAPLHILTEEEFKDIIVRIAGLEQLIMDLRDKVINK